MMAEEELSFLRSTQNSSIKKLKRELQRRVETQTRTIDDKYERKIQVEHVSIEKSIGNISKLCDEDENRRGREVIEMIRQIRQSGAHLDDFWKGKSKELQTLERDNRNIKNSLGHEIAELQTKNQGPNVKERSLRFRQTSIQICVMLTHEERRKGKSYENRSLFLTKKTGQSWLHLKRRCVQQGKIATNY